MKFHTTRIDLLICLLAGQAVSCLVQAQPCTTVEIKVEGGGNAWYHLFEYRDGQKEPADSAYAGNEGAMTFTKQGGYPVGIYRIQSGKERGLDFLVEGEKVVMTLDRQLSRQNAKVTSPPAGQLFFDYLAARDSRDRRLDLLIPLLVGYPVEDTFYRAAMKEARCIDDEFRAYIDDLLKQVDDRPLGRIIRLDLLEDVIPDKITPQRREFLKQHYFDGIDLTDSLLLRTPILSSKVIDYLSLFVIPGQAREAQEKAFISATDSLMKFTEASPEMQASVAAYLVDGFQAYGFEEVIRHLAENYLLKNTCVSEEETSKLRLRMEGFEKLAVGRIAPDFTATDAGGNIIRLSGVASPYRLLFFWSSECPHCKQILPGLKSLGREYSGKLQIIGISVDADQQSWKKAIGENSLEWPNIAELQGWDGPIVRSYYIYATPTFFLVDKEMKIVAKPLNVTELREYLNR